MLIAHFVGDHEKDTWLTRAGWALTRLAQKGPLDVVTHCEAIHAEHFDGSVDIASASLRDGGVRGKNATLNPLHWLITDVPVWSVQQSQAWFAEHDGEKYDVRGAWALFLPGQADPTRQFCTKAVAASVGIVTPECFSPAVFAAVCLSFGRDVTVDFFGAREVRHG